MSICSVQEAHDLTKQAVMGVLFSGDGYVCGCRWSWFDGRGVCVCTCSGLFFLCGGKYTEEDVALNPPVCDAQRTITYSASRLWYRWRGHPDDLMWSLSFRCFNQKLTCFDQFDRDPYELHSVALVETWKQLEEGGKVVAWAWFACICCIGSLPVNRNVLNTFVFGNAHSLLLVTFCSCFLSHTDAPSDEGLCERPSIHRVSNVPLLCLLKQSVWAHLQSGSGVWTSGRNILLGHLDSLDCGHTHRGI